MGKTVSIQYFEKPVTDDEKEIATLLQKIVQATITKNIDLLVSVYSDTASIVNLISRHIPLNKSEYRERMSNIMENIRDIYFRDAIIRVNGQEATISCLSIILLRDKILPEKNQRYYRCIKENGKWSIAESRYIVF